MMKPIVLFLPLLLLMPTGCSDTSTNPHAAPRNREAESMALYVSRELVAPQDLYEELLASLAFVRETWKDSIPDLDGIFFVPPWVPGQLLIQLTEEAEERYREGTYTDLDSLHTEFRLDSCSMGYSGSLRCVFKGLLHPERLAEAYKTVSSVVYAEPNGILFNTFNVYPWVLDTGRTFLFRNGWGDCPSGCIFNRYSYFKEIDGAWEWIGTFVHREDPEPDWWEEARIARDCFGAYTDCPL